MSVPKPHFLLFCDGSRQSQNESAHAAARGRWRFVLEDLDDGSRLEATDSESAAAPDRLALLAVVRGLEALSQPSRVTLVTSSRYVARGLQYGLSEWRENGYCWEHFGSVQPIRNADLWQRIDQALQYHSMTCRLMSSDEPQLQTAGHAGGQVYLSSQPIKDAQVGSDAVRSMRVDDAHASESVGRMHGESRDRDAWDSLSFEDSFGSMERTVVVAAEPRNVAFARSGYERRAGRDDLGSPLFESAEPAGIIDDKDCHRDGGSPSIWEKGWHSLKKSAREWINATRTSSLAT